MGYAAALKMLGMAGTQAASLLANRRKQGGSVQQQEPQVQETLIPRVRNELQNNNMVLPAARATQGGWTPPVWGEQPVEQSRYTDQLGQIAANTGNRGITTTQNLYETPRAVRGQSVDSSGVEKDEGGKGYAVGNILKAAAIAPAMAASGGGRMAARTQQRKLNEIAKKARGDVATDRKAQYRAKAKVDTADAAQAAREIMEYMMEVGDTRV